MEIKISELECIFKKIIAMLEFRNGKDGSLPLETDVYRYIPSSQWNKFDKIADWESTFGVNIGDLSHDLKQLLKLTTEKERQCSFVDFDRLSSILKEISQVENSLTQNPSKTKIDNLPAEV